jgi:hypothetical protein
MTHAGLVQEGRKGHGRRRAARHRHQQPFRGIAVGRSRPLRHGDCSPVLGFPRRPPGALQRDGLGGCQSGRTFDHQIREQSTKSLQLLSSKAFAVTPIRSIRAAGRRFHDDQNEAFRFFDGHRHSHEGTPGFFVALGAYRATVGQQVALLAAHYDIDIEGDLASVLPTLEEGET